MDMDERDVLARLRDPNRWLRCQFLAKEMQPAAVREKQPRGPGDFVFNMCLLPCSRLLVAVVALHQQKQNLGFLWFNMSSEA